MVIAPDTYKNLPEIPTLSRAQYEALPEPFLSYARQLVAWGYLKIEEATP